MLHQQAWLWKAFWMGGVATYHRSKMAYCIICVSSSSLVPMQKRHQMFNALYFGRSLVAPQTMVLKERGLNKLCWPGGSSKSCFENAHMMFSLTSAAMTTRTRTLNACLGNTSRSNMLLTTHEHDYKIIDKLDPTKTCARCGENEIWVRGVCEGLSNPIYSITINHLRQYWNSRSTA